MGLLVEVAVHEDCRQRLIGCWNAAEVEPRPAWFFKNTLGDVLDLQGVDVGYEVAHCFQHQTVGLPVGVEVGREAGDADEFA